ncbi:hypothetical protein CDL12_18035 [Handroanthus impetiginosus]|uniref:Uncharacterized protein n=1 Tax=Handroanthus impetiginosus TaxID=429701 RepID=A0A2G9GVW0_9LAMI|nr:hypothetical protein CDL12_18035 [Handroanthus impetiginosus]
MAMGAAGDGLLRGPFEGCISGDTGIQRRPYHKNCGCALHQSYGHCPHLNRYNNISYPIRRSWSESCLSLISHSSPSCSSSLAAAVITRTPSQLMLWKDDVEEEGFSPKV